MKYALVIGMAALTCACGGRSSDERPSISVQTSTGASEPLASAAAPDDAEQTVALVGCLRGPAPDTATGTAGEAATPRDVPPSTASGSAPTASASPYTLVDATPDESESGVGENGAGASGGPLVSGKATYLLDDIPNGARGGVNKQVRITGLKDARPQRAGEMRIEVQSVEVIGEQCRP